MSDDSGHPKHGDSVTLRGRVANRSLFPDRMKPRLALEREPGGQFLFLHSAEDADIDWGQFLGRWVEVEGELWTSQAITVTVVTEVDPPAIST